jgi:hypothetical protein
MKLALMGAVLAAAVAFATPALAQVNPETPGYCDQISHNADCQNVGSRATFGGGGYNRDELSGNATLFHNETEADEHRYHGGPKSND